MYRPHGRYRYTYGVASFSESRSYVSVLDHQCSQNWRAAAAMIVSVPLTLPGLIHSINDKIHVDVVGTRLFDIAYLLGVSVVLPRFLVTCWRSLVPADVHWHWQFALASTVYFTLSNLFPAHDTMLDHAILEPDTSPDDGSHSNSEGKDDTRADGVDVI